MQPPAEILLPKVAVVRYFGGSMGAVGRAFLRTTHRKPLVRQTVRLWGEYVPEHRARQLLDVYPDLKALLLDPISLRPAGPAPKPLVESR